jgi:hypothetical protein
VMSVALIVVMGPRVAAGPRRCCGQIRTVRLMESVTWRIRGPRARGAPPRPGAHRR